MNKKILIMRTENIGDFILSIPALLSIKKEYGEKNITLIIKNENKELAKKLNFKNILIYNNPLSKRNLKKRDVLLALPQVYKFIKNIRKDKFDIAIEFSGRKSNKIIMNLINSKKIINGSEKDVEKINEIEHCNKVAKKACKKIIQLNELPLKLNKTEKKALIKLTPKKDYIIIHPITPLKEKNWPIEKINELTKKLKKNHAIVFIGSKQDKKQIEKEIELNDKNIINLSGKLSLTQTYFLIKNAKLYLGMDSGPLHLARFTNTPIIAIFGNTNEKRWRPQKNCKIIKSKNISLIPIQEINNSIKKII